MKWKRFLSWLLVLILTACGANSAAAKTFSDVAADAEYAEGVTWCYEQGLMNGISDTQFDPDGTLTRAMVATILYRAHAATRAGAAMAFYTALKQENFTPAPTPAPSGSNTLEELSKEEETSVDQITLSFNGHTYAATLADNSSAEAFAELLKSKGGSMTIHMSEYGGWEKVGPLGQTLPSSNTQTTTEAGDFVLYSGNQIVLFYGSNTWSYTRLGHLDDPSGLREALGSADVEITFSI